jgi:hypothetical protein
MTTLIMLAVMALIILLARYAVAEGRRREAQKKFIKNMNDYDSKKK